QLLKNVFSLHYLPHYQHNQYEYELCDREGYVVWSEIPLINRATLGKETVPTKAFSNNIKQQLIEMIKQNYNHPAVFFWGISNELYDVSKETTVLYNELCKIIKEEDPSRISIYADNVASNEVRKRSLAADAVGYNRYDGWYYTRLGDMDTWVNNKISLDSRPTCISEYGAGAATTQHMDNVEKKDIKTNGTPHFEEYQSIYHEEAWVDIKSMKSVWGSFIWCMFDFASDARVEGDTQGQNDKGLVTRDRKIYKDAYYFYKSLWNKENMVYITDRRFTERSKTVPEVKIYSNAVKVELFVNGKSYGVVKRSDLDINYNNIFKYKKIILKNGIDNIIKAVATYSDGTISEDIVKWKVITVKK
ncbi:MAG: glycoside hydrolase family 2 TIM barrel-domain containing protein, partial [Mobilitalea sp.]